MRIRTRSGAERRRRARAGAGAGIAAPAPRANGRAPLVRRWALVAAALLAVAGIVAIAVVVGSNPDPTAAGTGARAAVLDIGVLVFREGLECILVLAAVTASMVGGTSGYRRPIALGAAAAFAATLVTWRIAVGVVDSLTESIPALHVQAATGLLAIIVLLVVMNWFFHKVYWSGWIGMHNRRKRDLLRSATAREASRARVLWGFALLGFTSLYREGVEVVLFLQSYRMKLGGTPVLHGVMLGLLLASVVAVLTFVAHHRLPYKRMLVLTGVLLGVVLLVMVGEQAQEMQLAHWLSTTPIPSLEHVIPRWMGLWLAVFPTVETLAAQAVAAVLVVGSYFFVRGRTAQTA
ncbi:MAG TPA: FTR1 family protein [Gemmatimonadaceae bacterium]|nr:FTR1 family protein [Gemmatimonadaceae bacterium]